MDTAPKTLTHPPMTATITATPIPRTRSTDNRYGDGYSYSRNYGHGTAADAYFPNNGYNNSYAHSTNKRSVKIAAQKTYLPLIDSSIVSMVPPPCFIKGTGKFAIPNIAKKNAGVTQFGKTAVRRLNTKRTATVPCSRPAGRAQN